MGYAGGRFFQTGFLAKAEIICRWIDKSIDRKLLYNNSVHLSSKDAEHLRVRACPMQGFADFVVIFGNRMPFIFA